MRNMKRFIICALVLAVASVNVFADTEVSTQMQYNFNENSEMGSFDIDEASIGFSTTQEDWTFAMDLSFTGDPAVTTDFLGDMYFDYAASDLISVKAGRFGTAFADGWWVGDTNQGVELYGSLGILGYQMDLVNGSNDKFAFQPVVTVTPIDILTLSFDGLFDWGDYSNNAVATSASLTVLDGWIFSEVYYGLDSEISNCAVEIGYTFVETITAEAYVEFSEADSLTNVGGYVDFDMLPVGIKLGADSNMTDDYDLQADYNVYVEFDYDFSL